ncbi:MAG: protease HtpX [Bdellovibrionales bacterium]|nr:protease HtpX [Bdellovibrionales bacterium]
MFKRIFLFMTVNILVMITISTTMSILGVGRYFTQYGIDYQQLAIFCLIWGMAGSFISLMLSKFMAKTMMGVQVIDPNTSDPHLRELVQTVHSLAKGAGLTTMPEVGIYDSPELNAFATGPSRSNSLVAVSSGLLGRMKSNEIEGVLAHEISHVANGDMVTMTLLQGIINAFVMFLARILAFFISQALRDRDSERSGGGNWVQYILVPIFEIALSILGSLVVAAFSRYREYRADAGGARLAGSQKMIAALQALKNFYENPRIADAIAEADQTPASIAAFKIATSKKSWIAFFASHPPLEERIAALEAASGQMITRW